MTQQPEHRTRSEIDREYNQLALILSDCLGKALVSLKRMLKLIEEPVAPEPKAEPEKQPDPAA
jgi:hypothetical protein